MSFCTSCPIIWDCLSYSRYNADPVYQSDVSKVLSMILVSGSISKGTPIPEE